MGSIVLCVLWWEIGGFLGVYEDKGVFCWFMILKWCWLIGGIDDLIFVSVFFSLFFLGRFVFGGMGCWGVWVLCWFLRIRKWGNGVGGILVFYCWCVRGFLMLFFIFWVGFCLRLLNVVMLGNFMEFLFLWGWFYFCCDNCYYWDVCWFWFEILF